MPYQRKPSKQINGRCKNVNMTESNVQCWFSLHLAMGFPWHARLKFTLVKEVFVQVWTQARFLSAQNWRKWSDKFSSVQIGTIQRRLAWPLHKDDVVKKDSNKKDSPFLGSASPMIGGVDLLSVILAVVMDATMKLLFNMASMLRSSPSLRLQRLLGPWQWP